MKKTHHSFTRIASVSILALAFIVQALPVSTAQAAQITNRKLTLMSGGIDTDSNGVNDGGSMPGGIANHLFNFSLSGGTVGSIKFEYCTTAAPVPGGIGCIAPTGLVTTGAVLGNQQGATGFGTITTPTANTVVLARASAASVTAGAVSYRIDGVKNPTSVNGETFFVRISTHNALNALDADIDAGTVAAATARAIELSGTMPESLVFCAGATIGVNAGQVPDCSTVTTGTIAFDKLFSPTDTATSESQMAASTNAGTGYVITVNGPTLTSGANTIAGMVGLSDTSTVGVRGTPQFGLNLVANTTTATDPFGAVVTQTGGALYTGTPDAKYDTPEEFKFTTSDPVAHSTGGSDAQIYTVAYMVNVPGSQPAGTYTTTLTYICTPTF
ncbi:MAG: exported protein of unknown function [Candidatus Saccharibacteria bacterium]|nr:exported protein of unknown function [Candidatus Saccharibacteria bacterium]